MASRKLFLPPTKRAHAGRIAYLFAMVLLLPFCSSRSVTITGPDLPHCKLCSLELSLRSQASLPS